MKHFYSCDWGTTSFRLRRVDVATGAVIEERHESSGAKKLYTRCVDQGLDREVVFSKFLSEQLLAMAPKGAVSLDGATVIISGMASSSIGWRELPYAKIPCGLDGLDMVCDSSELSIDAEAQVRVHLLSGMCTEVDIMRGEEMEILGIFAGEEYDEVSREGVVILPGTHSKHIHLEWGRIVDFRTFMTGELFDVLSVHSVLRASLRTENDDSRLRLSESEPACCEAFVRGVQTARYQGLARGLFHVRSRTVLKKVPEAVNRWYLSGLLIGAEIVDLLANNSDAPILLAAAKPLSAPYELAFEAAGLMNRLSVVPPSVASSASVRGHLMMFRNLESQNARA